MTRPSVRWTAAIGAAAALTVTGCGATESSTATSSPAASVSQSTTASADQLVAAAADSTAALTGAEVEINVDGTIPGLTAKEVSAEINTKPPAGKGTAVLRLGDKEAKTPFVYVDDKFYANVDGKGWLNYGDGRSIYDVSRAFDPEHGLPALLRGMEGATTVGTEKVDDVATTKVTGTVSAAALAALTGGPAPKADAATPPVPATVWITGDNQVARVSVVPAPKATMTIDISDWNSTVTVTAPSDVKTPTATPSAPPASGQPTRLPTAG